MGGSSAPASTYEGDLVSSAPGDMREAFPRSLLVTCLLSICATPLSPVGSGPEGHACLHELHYNMMGFVVFAYSKSGAGGLCLPAVRALSHPALQLLPQI